jgi:hypothetical protein
VPGLREETTTPASLTLSCPPAAKFDLSDLYWDFARPFLHVLRTESLFVKAIAKLLPEISGS